VKSWCGIVACIRCFYVRSRLLTSVHVRAGALGGAGARTRST
jgi:hypothetical protein